MSATSVVTSDNLSQYVYNILVSMEGAANNEFKVDFGPPGGASGMSFGFMQNDLAHQGMLTATGLSAATLLSQALSAYGVSSSEVASLTSRASTPGVQSSAFTDGEITQIENALAADASAVNAQDNTERSQ